MDSQPTVIGPYRLLEPLGRGGMGSVHRAVHQDSGEVVALKTVELGAAVHLDILRREILALQALHHPGIVRIVGDGVADGTPWLAMELVPGKTLGAWAGQLPSRFGATRASSELLPDLTASIADLDPPTAHPDAASASPGIALSGADLVDVLTLVADLCDALSYLHGEGVVHRDLKPANIMVRPEGVPVLVDFGLLGRFHGRETVAGSLGTVGTLAYMAPEQLRGEAVDARADLYALGCILYELTTGARPFGGPSLGAVVAGHLTGVPVPPSELIDTIDPALEALILGLLAKVPSDRPGYAVDVARVLRACGARPTHGPTGRSYVYRPRLAGRDEELDALDLHVERLTTGSGGVVLLVGDSGMGKTRLALEVARGARQRPITVLAAACDPADAPLGPLHEPLRTIAERVATGLTEESVLAVHLAVLGELVPRLAQGPVTPPVEPLDPSAARQRLYRALEAVLAVEAPVLLLLDEVHHAGDLLRGWLRRLARRREGPLVLGTRRPDAGPALPGADVVQVRPLGVDAVTRMVADMLAMDAIPPGLGAVLHQRSEGNALFVAEFLLLAVEGGLLEREPGGRWRMTADGRALDADSGADLPMPGSIRDLLSQRIAHLSGHARAVAEVAAVLGRSFATSLLVEVVGREGVVPAEDVPACLVALEQARLVGPEGLSRRLAFTHGSVRDVLVDGTAPPRATELHRLAAAALDTLCGEDPSTAAQRAAHWEAAGELERAVEAYRRAATWAAEHHAVDEAADLHRRVLELVPPAERARDRESLIIALQHASRLVEARREAEAWLRQAHGPADEGHARVMLGGVLRVIGDAAAALAALEPVRTELLSPRMQIRWLEHQASALHRVGDVQAATVLLGQLRQRLTEAASGDETDARTRSEQINASLGLAALTDQRGAYPEARALYDQALADAVRWGLRHAEMNVLMNMAVGRYALGARDEAEHIWRRGLDLARELGHRRNEAILMGHLATLEASAGRLHDAVTRFESAIAILDEVGDTRNVALNMGNLASCHHELGDFGQARALYTRALAIRRELGEARGVAILERSLASIVRVGEGDLDLADELVGRALATLRALGRDVQLVGALVELGHIGVARGAPRPAALEEARAVVAQLGAGPSSQIAQLVAELEQVTRLHAAGAEDQLYRGERRAAVPGLAPPSRVGDPP